jgi:hypothetical protein
MRKTLIATAVVLTAAVCLLGRYEFVNFDIGSRATSASDPLADIGTPAGTPLAAPKAFHGLKLSTHTRNAYQYMLELFASLPSGTSLDQSQFDKVLGTDAATFLRSMNVTHLDSLNHAVHVTLSKQYETKAASADIRLDTTVSFTFSENASGTLICDNIVGINVNASALLGWMPVKHVEVSHDTAGNTIIEVEVSSLFGTIKRTIKLDPDGNPLP